MALSSGVPVRGLNGPESRAVLGPAMQLANTANQVEFRYALQSDITEIVALFESAYRGDASRVGWTTEADLLDGQRTDREEVLDILADQSARLLLAILSGRIVGCVVMRKEDDGVYVGMLSVRPNMQGDGLGKRLLDQVDRLARDEFRASQLRMTVIEQRRELIEWYGRRGYRATGKVKPFPYGNPRFGLPKREDLRFVVLEKQLA